MPSETQVKKAEVTHVTQLKEGIMRRLLLTALIGTGTIGCAPNRSADEPGTRVRDTSLTVQDTMSDTLTGSRDNPQVDSTR